MTLSQEIIEELQNELNRLEKSIDHNRRMNRHEKVGLRQAKFNGIQSTIRIMGYETLYVTSVLGEEHDTWIIVKE